MYECLHCGQVFCQPDKKEVTESYGGSDSGNSMCMPQKELSNKLGIERKSYYNWLTKGNIPIPMLINLAELFNCSTDYLLGRTRTP